MCPVRSPPEPEVPALRAFRASGFSFGQVLGFASRAEVPALRASRASGFAIGDSRGFAAEGGSHFGIGINAAVDPDPDDEEETAFDIDILNGPNLPSHRAA